MFRSLSTKLLVAVLAAVILPFGGFAFFLESQIAGRMVRDYVRESLGGLAGNLAQELDSQLLERQEDMELLAFDPMAAWALEEALAEPGSFGSAERLAISLGGDTNATRNFQSAVARTLDRTVRLKQAFDLLVLVTPGGELCAMNGLDPEGAPLPDELVERLFESNFAQTAWHRTALSGSIALVDHHPSALLYPNGPPEQREAVHYHVGIAAPVPAYPASHPGQIEVVGVVYGLVSWAVFQDRTETPLIKDAFRGLVSSGEVPSPYAWVWDTDGDTILAHNNPNLYYSKVSGPKIGLPEMVADVQGKRSGMYRGYRFEGLTKTAAFHRTQPVEEYGFDWVVGVGINDSDIVAASRDQRRLLARGTWIVLLTVLLWVLVIARRTTRPIEVLEEHTERVAEGNLEARVEIDREDELGRLGIAMNRMTAELASQRDQLVKAEKDAAWREMARQVAHDLKNPLTPILLSLDLFERARNEKSPREEEILQHTIQVVRRQVESLREVATDFHEFTGGTKPRPERFDLRERLERVFDLHKAWAIEQSVQMSVQGPESFVHVDPGKLERVLTNLVVNAFHAMPSGGRLEARLEQTGGRTRLTLSDTGEGLTETTRRRLFQPYFTTKSHGTGLGLAIAARILDDMGGSIELRSEGPGSGAMAVLELPTAGDVSDSAESEPELE